MKNSITFLAGILLLTVVILSACQSSPKKAENAGDKVEQTKQDSISEYQQFKNEAETKILAQEKNINDLKAKIANEKKDIKDDYEKKLLVLENTNNDLKEKLAALKDDGQNGWISFKNEFNHDMDELGKAFKDFTVENII